MSNPETVGLIAANAITYAALSALSGGEPAWFGAACGFAFRAAELAYDLGQEHARKQIARARLRPRVLTPEEVEADRAATAARRTHHEQDASRRAGLRWALDTRN